MSTKHEIRLGDFGIGQAVNELLADRLDDVVRHYGDPQSSGKASKIKVEVQVLPDERRPGRYAVAIQATTTLSPKLPYGSIIFAEVTGDGLTVMTEHDPRQLRIPFGEPSAP